MLSFLSAAFCLVLYGLTDPLTIRPAKGAARLAAVGMLSIWHYFMSGVTYESLQRVLPLLLRNFGQTLVIYTLVLLPARLLRREPPPIRTPHAALLQRS